MLEMRTCQYVVATTIMTDEVNVIQTSNCSILSNWLMMGHLQVRKLADYLTTLETESGFVSNEATKSQIQSLIERILADLNQTRRYTMAFFLVFFTKSFRP